MTPPRRWEINLNGHRHSVAFSWSITSDRQNQIMVDRNIVAIDWRPAEPRRIRGAPSEYEASFDIEGRRAVLSWYRSPHERDLTSRLAEDCCRNVTPGSVGLAVLLPVRD